ncbi:hypothetical protein JYP52_21270 [Nitratireductor aquibiodomus]|uniref:hypothetical protein n=1 Tax=Nitratireductor TaxID=245876 RepID=UPI000DDD7BF4|nr:MULTISPECIES: hypothetical protein [Nitratireductor]MBN7763672.1 hypothetical protein [Nitratireductor aquibiodomus]
MALTITKKKGKATVSSATKNKGEVISEDATEEIVDLPDETAASEGSSGPWCEVGTEMSYTHNLGNYQSARLQVSLKVPCLHSEVDQVFDFAKEWTDQKLQGMVAELSEE